MIQITRSLARQLRAIIRKSVLVGASRYALQSVALRTDEQGLRIRVPGPEVAVEYHQPGALPPETICLPTEALDNFAGAKDTSVLLETIAPGTVQARWDDGGVPQVQEYSVKEGDAFPEFPEAAAWVPQEPRLLTALAEAVGTTAKETVRYALTRIQLRGGKAGQIVATDGRQLFMEGGFRFPWDDHFLIPAVSVFGSKALPRAAIAITRTAAHLGVRIGPWTFWLLIDTAGRYPRVEDVIPAAASRRTSCRLSASEAAFLARALPRLPRAEDDDDDPVTVDLNGHVAVRSKGTDHVTEVDLPGSTVSGPPVRCRTNRRYLARALALGFTEFQLANADTPVACLDGPRTYVWMPLPKEKALPPSDDIIRITPPAQEPNQPPITKERKPALMPAPTSNGTTNGHVAERPAKTRTEPQPQAVSLGVLITEAQALKEALRDAYHRSGRLLVAVKRHRRQSKLLASTVTALKQLQSIGG